MGTALWIVVGIVALAALIYVLYVGLVVFIIRAFRKNKAPPAIFLVLDRWMVDILTGDILDTKLMAPVRWISVKRSPTAK